MNRTGRFWTVVSWIVPAPDGNAHHTPHVPVMAGETLTGVIPLVDTTASGYAYKCEFQGLDSTSFITPPIPELTWCSETLEAYELRGDLKPPYDLNAGAEYPAADFTSFQGINVSFKGSRNGELWTTTDYETKFGESVEVKNDSVSDGEIRIHYRAAAKTSS